MIYDFTARDITGRDIALSDYRGKVLLIVNTAIKCGFTPQYAELEKLYSDYKDKGFEILDFPCNQFFKQAPGSDDELKDFCTLNYGTTFKMFSKIDVNGKDAHPLYQFLRANAPVSQSNSVASSLFSKLSSLGFHTTGDEIKWNFTKFLIDRQGNIVGKFAPSTNPHEFIGEIDKII